MGKQSQIDKRIAEFERDIAVNQHAIAVLRSVQQKKDAKPTKQAKTSRTRRGEGASTDSGNMNYPPA